MDTDYIKTWLKDNLTADRYAHSIGTAGCAVELARMYELDEEKAYLAGLLHDCAKCKTKEEMQEIVGQKLYDMNPNEVKSAKILHAPIGAYIARDGFGITDPDVLSAIRWHTVGKPGMNTFESVIFLADKIEPSMRNGELREQVFKLLRENEKKIALKKAMLLCFKTTIKSLAERELPIFPITIDTYNDLLKSTQEK